jgi:primosomal protein N' (replication factor Y)
LVVGVLVELSSKNIDKIFDYNVPLELVSKIKVGIRVTVPFGRMTLEGFVLEIKDKKTTSKELKSIIDVVDKDIVLNKELLELGKVMRNNTLSTLISCYQVMLPKALKAHVGVQINKKYDYFYKVNGDISNLKLNDKQKEIIELCKDDFVLKSELVKISVSSFNTLLKKGVLIEERREHYRLNYNDSNRVIHKLTPKQKEIYDEIIGYKDLKPSLIYGVTGSGKTEIYMELIDYYLKKGKTALLLVPEISLTAQLINRFVDRFGNKIAALHSALSDGERYDEYRRIQNGEATIVIGARSAVFAPLERIGIIIVDEEHTDSYKQSESNPRYNAKEIALIRGEMHKCKVVFGSATPSLEAMARAKKGVFHLLSLMERVNGKELPEVKIIDMNKEIRRTRGHFSLELVNAIREKVALGEQVILLLNRRGYASFVTCKNCGHTFKCPNCDISLTYHKSSNTMRCHYCGYADKKPFVCPECHEKSINDLGVGTQRIEEELEKLVDAKVLRMDYDTTSRKGSHEKMITAFKNHEYDILLGTQMVSKGLDFPLVTLVGVINADTSLNIPDYNSAFNTFSLLNQVSGRAGRSEKSGVVYIQTFNKDHYAIKYASENDYFSFYEEEMRIRRLLKYPPYYYLCYIRISGKENNLVNNEANKIKRSLDRNISDIILGPSPSILYKINNIYRYSIIIKYKNIDNIRDILIKINDHYKTNNNVKIEIDFNHLHIM